MDNHVSMKTMGMSFSKEKGKATVFKRTLKTSEKNERVVYTHLLYVPTSLVKKEDEEYYVPTWWMIKCSKPKVFKFQVPDKIEHSLCKVKHTYGPIIPGPSDSWTKVCTKCGHVEWDE
jgi:hypothetical protein